jgi:hypoxanthine phosphoribosyltransferase
MDPSVKKVARPKAHDRALDEIEFETPSWDYFYQLCLELGDAIKRSGFRPDVLIGISRGGLIPLRILSDLFEDAVVATVKVEFYEDVAKTGKEPRITQPVSVDIMGKSVLIVDDVADTGRSLAMLKRGLEEKGTADLRIATVYYKPWSILVPNYFIRGTVKWIIFPHERRETVFKLASSYLSRGKSLEEVKDRLIQFGLEPLLVRRFLKEYGEEMANHRGRASGE